MKNLLLFLMLISCSISFATEQTKDSLVYDGKGYYIQNKFIFEEILTDFVESNGYNLEYPITNLWRGYKAVFEIKENKIFLKDLKSYVFNEKDSLYYFQSVITEEIKQKIQSQKLNTVIIASDTDEYWEEKSFDEGEYWVFEFKKSKLSKKLSYNYKELENFKEDQFLKFKKTKEFNREMEECNQMVKENIQEFSNPNIPNFEEDYRLELLESYKNYDCNGYIKEKLFSLWPSFNLYHKIL